MLIWARIGLIQLQRTLLFCNNILHVYILSKKLKTLFLPLANVVFTATLVIGVFIPIFLEELKQLNLLAGPCLCHY